MTAYQLTLTGTGGPLVLPLDRIYCTRTVSYTHLDVYKRQVVDV